MAFSISFLDEPLDDLNGAPGAWGRIELGDFQERFLANLSAWSVRDYETHWKEQLACLLTGAERIALITLFQRPADNAHLEWWALYREGKTVHAQNQIRIFEEHIVGPFSLECALNSLSDRQTVSDEGDKISEWQIEIGDIERFLASKVVG